MSAIVALISIPTMCDALYDDTQNSVSYEGIEFTIVDGDKVELTEVTDPDLKTLIIPAAFDKDGRTYHVIGIDASVLYHNFINRIEIPSTVTYIKGHFHGLVALEWFEVDPSNEHLCSIDGVLFDINMMTIMAYPISKPDKAYDIPDAVTVISEYCFSSAENLESVTMSDKIVLIGMYAFDICRSLEKINHDGAINRLPSMLRIIGEGAFNGCEKLTNVELPESLMVIGSNAFNECIGLTSMSIPYEVVDIGSGFLSRCINISSIEVSDFSAYFESRDGVMYYKHSNSSSVSLHTYPCGKPGKSFKVPDDVNAIDSMAFSGTVHLEKLTLSNNMKSIGSYAVFGCETLKEVYIPSSVMSIGNMAFSMCSNLTTVNGGNNVSVIEILAFSSTNLTSAFLPDSLRIIEPYAFNRNPGITEVTLPVSVESVGIGVFSDCLNLTTITILGSDTVLMEGSLGVGVEDHVVEVQVNIQSDMHLPDNVFDEYTIGHVSIIGEEPYPYENLIGVAICLLVLFFIIRLFREV